MPEEPPDELSEGPWDEFKWEEFLKESDERADKLGRIIEQHSDDPNLEDIISREMGWDKFDSEDETGEVPDSSEFGFEEEEDEEGEGWKRAAGIPDESPSQADFHDDPLYEKAFSLAIESHDWAESLPGEIKNLPEVSLIFSNAAIPAAKIAAGYSDDEDPEMLGFRIATYKRGLAAANKSLDAMSDLGGKNLVDRKKLLALTGKAREVRNSLAIRILELREKFGG